MMRNQEIVRLLSLLHPVELSEFIANGVANFVPEVHSLLHFRIQQYRYLGPTLGKVNNPLGDESPDQITRMTAHAIKIREKFQFWE